MNPRAYRNMIANGVLLAALSGYVGTESGYRALVSGYVEPSGALIPTRGGAAERWLEDTSGQITDSGAPDYNYPGLSVDTLGADGLTIVAGDQLGVPYLWDLHLEEGAGTVVGLPSTVRDGDLIGFTVSNYINNISLSTPSGDSTFLIEITTPASWAGTKSIIFPLSSGTVIGTGIGLFLTNGGDARVSTRIAGVQQAFAEVPVGTGTRYYLSVVYSAGAVTIRRYDSGGTQTHSDTDSGSAVTPDLDTYTLGGLAGGAQPEVALTVHQWRIFDGALTATELNEVIDGTDVTGGGTLAHNLLGFRTGVFDSLDLTRLITEANSGLPVTAET